jgi:hypothetical protein
MYFVVAYEHTEGLQTFMFHNHELFETDSYDNANSYLDYAKMYIPDKDWKLFEGTFTEV